MTELTWGDGVVLTVKYWGQFSIKYTTSDEAGAWKIYYESYLGSKITYEMYGGSMNQVITKGMTLFDGVVAETTILKDIDNNIVI